MEFLYSLDYYHWILLGLVLLVLEIFSGGAFLMWLGLSAIALGVLVLVLPWVGIHLAWEWQLVLFGLGSFSAIILWRRFGRKLSLSDVPGLNQRGVAYVGRVVTLKEPIDDGVGYIHIDDTRWRINGPDLPAGAKVKLIELRELVFIVEQVAVRH